MTKAALCLLACLAIAGCTTTPTTTVTTPGTGATAPGAGCVDGFGPIQSGTEICVGHSG